MENQEKTLLRMTIFLSASLFFFLSSFAFLNEHVFTLEFLPYKKIDIPLNKIRDDLTKELDKVDSYEHFQIDKVFIKSHLQGIVVRFSILPHNPFKIISDDLILPIKNIVLLNTDLLKVKNEIKYFDYYFFNNAKQALFKLLILSLLFGVMTIFIIKRANLLQV